MILAASADSAAAAGTFWSAMLTTIPVLALALIVEAGRQIRSAGDLRWGTRLLLTVLFGGYGFALIISFYVSVDALTNRDGLERAVLVGSLLSGAFLVLVGMPLADIALRLNPELRTVLVRLIPWSRWRRLRRKLRAGLKDTRKLLREVDDGLRERSKVLRHAEQAVLDAESSRERLEGSRRFKAQLPAGVEAKEAWEKVEQAIQDGEVDHLKPGSMLGELEFQLETLRLNQAEALTLRGRVQRLIRKTEIRLRGTRVFRFDLVERSGFKSEIAALQREFDSLPKS